MLFHFFLFRTQLRRCLSQAVPDTSAEAAQFPEKIQKIVNDISQLSLFEVAELNKLLKITLNISDVPVMAYGGPAAPKAEEVRIWKKRSCLIADILFYFFVLTESIHRKSII